MYFKLLVIVGLNPS